MSTSMLPPPPGPLPPLQERIATSPSQQRIVKSPPLPKLPRYLYVTRTYKPRRICTCDTPHEKTYFQPLLICRAYKCPVRYYHAQCVGEAPLHPLDPTAWCCQHCRSDNVIPARICVCGEDLPNPSRPMVQCSRKGNCRARWYHKVCVGTPGEGEEWICFECEERDREDQEELQLQQVQVEPLQRQPRQQLQQRNQQTQQSRQSQQTQQKQPSQQSRQPQQSQQKRKKRQHQDEPEDDEDPAPSEKRVRFSSDKEDERPVIPRTRRNAARPARSQPNAGDPQEQNSDEGSSPEETEYCFCSKPSNMQMIACDGKKCTREWFHFECVGVTKKTVPKGKWYCDECGAEAAKKKAKSGKAKKAKKATKKGRRTGKRCSWGF